MKIIHFLYKTLVHFLSRQSSHQQNRPKKVSIVSVLDYQGYHFPRYAVDAEIEQVRQLLEGTHLPLIDSSKPLDRKWLMELVREYSLDDKACHSLMKEGNLSLLNLSTFAAIVKQESDLQLQKKSKSKRVIPQAQSS